MKKAFTLAEVVSLYFKDNSKAAFTLAEVLITLGIIGIVAAMTLPALIQKNNNRVVETRLMKFYSSINQAVKMTEVDYGDKKIWFEDVKGAEIDKDGKPVPGSSDAEKWFNKYFTPYMKIKEIKVASDGNFRVYFPDGSTLEPSSMTTRDWVFYPGNYEKCKQKIQDKSNGICRFYFNFKPNSTNVMWKHHYNKGFEPWKYAWLGDVNDLKNACYTDNNMGDTSVGGRAYCTALIQLNNWKIPDDYPYKVSY